MISSQKQLATAVTLPQPEVPKFSGDPTKHKTFIIAFDARIQARLANDADRLNYLDQHLTGEPKDLIGGCLHLEPDVGYKEAKDFSIKSTVTHTRYPTPPFKGSPIGLLLSSMMVLL